ncbi:hypothetical protein [Legionella tunisiensis]|uniref:hypothetical protein n=1 Tax=Legionella tunisiensis TaxID=1034944 RepID=UPI0002F4F849|nr:hypothetical protein [Legionella tunisiensis]
MRDEDNDITLGKILDRIHSHTYADRFAGMLGAIAAKAHLPIDIRNLDINTISDTDLRRFKSENAEVQFLILQNAYATQGAEQVWQKLLIHASLPCQNSFCNMSVEESQKQRIFEFLSSQAQAEQTLHKRVHEAIYTVFKKKPLLWIARERA